MLLEIFKFLLLFIMVFTNLYIVTGLFLGMCYYHMNYKMMKERHLSFSFVSFTDKYGREDFDITTERHIREIVLHFYKFNWLHFFKIFFMIVIKKDYSILDKYIESKEKEDQPYES